MPMECSVKIDVHFSSSDAVRCSWNGSAGHASAKRFMPVGGWHIMLRTETRPFLLSSSTAGILNSFTGLLSLYAFCVDLIHV